VIGALVAVAAVAVAGSRLRASLMRLPETELKDGVGLVLSSFGIVFLAEGAGAAWPRRGPRAGLRRGDPGPGQSAHHTPAGGGAVNDLRKLLLGETRNLPGGVAAITAAALALDALAVDWWPDVAGWAVLAAGVALVVASTLASAGLRRR
jgi:hypothetical protein